MKIVIVCTLYPPYILGGAEVSTAILAESLVLNGHSVYVITTGDNDVIETIDGVKIYRIKNQNIYWRYPQRDKSIIRKAIWHFIDIYNVFYQKKIKKILTDIDPDIVHTGNLCGLSCIIWSIASNLKIPVVHTLRDYYLLCPQQTMIKNDNSCEKQCRICRLYSIIKKKSSKKVNAVVGISRFILNQHLNYGYFNEAKTYVIPNSVDYVYNCISHRATKDIGYIGRISPEKGLEFMIEAFNKSEHGTSKLIIAGSGNKKYEKQLKQKYENDFIHFIGVSKPEDFFQNIGLLIVPSLWKEPFGRVVIEAYNYCVPVLMADNGGLSELVANGISMSFPTSSTDVLISLLDAYFSGIISFNNEKFKEVISNYSENKVSSSYIDLYKSVIDCYHRDNYNLSEIEVY